MLPFFPDDRSEPKGRKAVIMLTLKKLKELVDSPKRGERKLTFKKLRKGESPVVSQKVIQNDAGSVTITVYKNGYVVYQALNRVTVFLIEEISGYHYSSVVGNDYGCDLDEAYFDEAEWYLRFVFYGEDRLSINLDSRNKKHCISFTSVMEEMQFGEAETQNMEDVIIQQLMTESMMEMLMEKQKELVYALYFENQTYQEYATVHGISTAAVNNLRKKAMNRLSAGLQEDSKSVRKKNLRKK